MLQAAQSARGHPAWLGDLEDLLGWTCGLISVTSNADSRSNVLVEGMRRVSTMKGSACA